MHFLHQVVLSEAGQYGAGAAETAPHRTRSAASELNGTIISEIMDIMQCQYRDGPENCLFDIHLDRKKHESNVERNGVFCFLKQVVLSRIGTALYQAKGSFHIIP